MLGVLGMALLDRRRHERAVDDPDLADKESLALAPPAALARPSRWLWISASWRISSMLAATRMSGSFWRRRLCRDS